MNNKRILFFVFIGLLLLSSVMVEAALSQNMTEQSKIEEARAKGKGAYIWYAMEVFIGVLATAILLGLMLKYLGLGDVLQQIFNVLSQIFEFARNMLLNIVTSAPKFIRVIFFIILFWLGGYAVYNMTAGLPLVCHNGDLYSGDYMEGVIYYLLPEPNLTQNAPVSSSEIITNWGFGSTEVTGLVSVNADGTANILVPYGANDYTIPHVEISYRTGIPWPYGFKMHLCYTPSENRCHMVADSSPMKCWDKTLYDFTYVVTENAGGDQFIASNVDTKWGSLSSCQNITPLQATALQNEYTIPGPPLWVCVEDECGYVWNVFTPTYKITQKPSWFQKLFNTCPQGCALGLLSPWKTYAVPTDLEKYDAYVVQKSDSGSDSGSSPDYTVDASKRALSKSNFVELYWTKDDARSYSSSKPALFSYKCDCNEYDDAGNCAVQGSDGERLMLGGIDIFDWKIMLAIVIIGIVVGILYKK